MGSSATSGNLGEACAVANHWSLGCHMELAGPHDLGWQPSGAPPSQIPPGPMRLVGREAVLARLAGALSQGEAHRPAIMVVSGPSGVGKSALVRHWAHTVQNRFPGGQLYVDYSAIRTESGAPISDAVADSLLALGVHQELVPPAMAERVELFRAKTAAAPVLVVLDDVTEPAHVLPFVPTASGSVVVAISPVPLTELGLDGASFVPLAALDEASAIALLSEGGGTARLSNEAEAVRQLVAHCSGLPVALRVAASLLAARPQLKIARLVQELEHESTALAAASRDARAVFTLFDVAYRALPRDAAKLYRALGASMVLTFDSGTASVMLGGTRAVVSPLLNRLLRASLIEKVSEDRFGFHELVRRHARERSAAEDFKVECAAVRRRLFTSYHAKAAFADRAIMDERIRIVDLRTLLRGQTSPFVRRTAAKDALEWLVAERVNLLLVLRAMADDGEDESAWQLAEFMLALYVRRSYFEDWIEAGEIGVEAAHQSGNADAEALLRSMTSTACMAIGEIDRVQENLDQALALVKESDNKALSALVWELMGRFRERAHPGSSVEAYRQAVKRNVEAGERRGEAVTTYLLGCAVSMNGDRSSALKILKRARDLLIDLDDKPMAGWSSIKIGMTLFFDGSRAAAREALEQAVKVFAEAHADRGEAKAREFLAEVVAEVDDATTARSNFERVREICRANDEPDANDLKELLERLT